MFNLLVFNLYISWSSFELDRTSTHSSRSKGTLNDPKEGCTATETAVPRSGQAYPYDAEKKPCKTDQVVSLIEIGGDRFRGFYRKKAIRDIDLSSCGEREDANMERRTAGVTGIRRVLSACNGWGGCGRAVLVVDTDEGMVA